MLLTQEDGSFWFGSKQNSSAVCQLPFNKENQDHMSQPFCAMVLLPPSCNSADFKNMDVSSALTVTLLTGQTLFSEKTSRVVLMA